MDLHLLARTRTTWNQWCSTSRMMNAFVDTLLMKKLFLLTILNFVALAKGHFAKVVSRGSQLLVTLNSLQMMYLKGVRIFRQRKIDRSTMHCDAMSTKHGLALRWLIESYHAKE